MTCAARIDVVTSVVMNSTDVSGAIRVVWRIESARLIARLTRLVQDVGLAEELAQDAFVTALEQWPRSGIPDNPGAWLMTTGKHRALDHLRHQRMRDRKHMLMHESDMDPEHEGGLSRREPMMKSVMICCG